MSVSEEFRRGMEKKNRSRPSVPKKEKSQLNEGVKPKATKKEKPKTPKKKKEIDWLLIMAILGLSLASMFALSVEGGRTKDEYAPPKKFPNI
jgi:hypothetical protein